MTPTAEICKNCQHQKQAVGGPHFRRHCLVWDRLTYANDTCQYFQIAQRLLPTLEDIHKLARKTKRKTVREREGKPNIGPL